MIGKYIGKDNLNFKNGKVYEIETKCQVISGNGINEPTPCICVYNVLGNGWCSYINLETMLDDWEIQ